MVFQLWRKFNLEFYYLDAATIKYAVLIELNKAQKIMDNLEKLVELNARIFLKFQTLQQAFLIYLFLTKKINKKTLFLIKNEKQKHCNFIKNYNGNKVNYIVKGTKHKFY